MLKNVTKTMLAIIGTFILLMSTAQAEIARDHTYRMDKILTICVVKNEEANITLPKVRIEGLFTNLYDDSTLTTKMAGTASVDVTPGTSLRNPVTFRAWTPDPTTSQFEYVVTVSLEGGRQYQIIRINQDEIWYDDLNGKLKIAHMHSNIDLGSGKDADGVMLSITVGDDFYQSEVPRVALNTHLLPVLSDIVQSYVGTEPKQVK